MDGAEGVWGTGENIYGGRGDTGPCGSLMLMAGHSAAGVHRWGERGGGQSFERGIRKRGERAAFKARSGIHAPRMDGLDVDMIAVQIERVIQTNKAGSVSEPYDSRGGCAPAPPSAHPVFHASEAPCSQRRFPERATRVRTR